jgi:hypothetical protein
VNERLGLSTEARKMTQNSPSDTYLRMTASDSPLTPNIGCRSDYCIAIADLSRDGMQSEYAIYFYGLSASTRR